jgi:hypothetical protein
MEDLQFSKDRRFSEKPESTPRKANTDRKTSFHTGSKFKITRANSFKDAPLSSFIYLGS